MSAKLYRNIPVADVPDADDWVADQAIPDDVVDVYTLWPGRASIEVTAVWWDASALPAGVGAAVYDAGAVGLQPVEIKRVAASDAVDDISAFTAIVAATSTLSAPAFVKQSLGDSSPDEMYLRVTAGTPPVGATHLRLVVEVTP
mgnify:FL=1